MRIIRAVLTLGEMQTRCTPIRNVVISGTNGPRALSWRECGPGDRREAYVIQCRDVGQSMIFGRLVCGLIGPCNSWMRPRHIGSDRHMYRHSWAENNA